MIPFTLITWAEKEIESGFASIYMSMIPIFSVILAHFLTEDEKILTKKLIGTTISFAGVLFLLWKSLAGITLNLLAQLACLLAAFCYAYSRIKTKQLTNI